MGRKLCYAVAEDIIHRLASSFNFPIFFNSNESESLQYLLQTWWYTDASMSTFVDEIYRNRNVLFMRQFHFDALFLHFCTNWMKKSQQLNNKKHRKKINILLQHSIHTKTKCFSHLLLFAQSRSIRNVKALRFAVFSYLFSHLAPLQYARSVWMLSWRNDAAVHEMPFTLTLSRTFCVNAFLGNNDLNRLWEHTNTTIYQRDKIHSNTQKSVLFSNVWANIRSITIPCDSKEMKIAHSGKVG